MDEQKLTEDYTNACQKSLAEGLINCDRTRRAMFYRCGDCGLLLVIWLERGLEETGWKLSKPVPFAVRCPECGGTHMFHVEWQNDIFLRENAPIPNDSYYFANVRDKDCGVLSKKRGRTGTRL